MSQWKRVTILSDNHGDAGEPLSQESAFKFIESYRPELRLHIGDAFDFRPLRRKANEDEKRESLLSDYEAGKAFLERYQPTHYLRGNHCERLWDLAKYGVGIQRDFALQGVSEIETMLASMSCSVYPYEKRTGFLQIGELGFVHGSAHGANAIKQNITAYGSRVKGIIQGHTHTSEYFSSPSIDDREGWVCPCLCRLDMDYNRCALGTFKGRNGWMYGVIHEKTGKYEVWTARGVDGTYLLPSGITEF